MEGALRQDAIGENFRAVTGDPAWMNYTLTLKARNLGGSEGFPSCFKHRTSPTRSGGTSAAGKTPSTRCRAAAWRKTMCAVRLKRIVGMIFASNCRDGSVKAFLDGKLIHEADRKPVATFYAAAGRDQRAGELVLQMVNPFAESMSVAVKLNGAGKLGKSGPDDHR